MADTKRSSINNAVATPKTTGGGGPGAAPPMVDAMDALGKATGARVKLTTTAPHSQSYEGVLFTACPILNVVALDTRLSSPGSPGNAASHAGDYHIIPVSRLQSFQVVELGRGEEEGGGGGVKTAVPGVGPLDIKRLKQREEERVRALKEEEQDRGKGVSKEGQDLFDALKKIGQSVRWHTQEIIVNDQVIIQPPYRPEDCRGPKPQQEQVNRIKAMLQGERKKLKEREEKKAAAASATAGPRKGG